MLNVLKEYMELINKNIVWGLCGATFSEVCDA